MAETVKTEDQIASAPSPASKAAVAPAPAVVAPAAPVESVPAAADHIGGEDVGYKVFVGNLSFQTSEQELAQFFGSVGKVLKANIITRGTRSLGYGFVAFETIADAEEATKELDKKELGGRVINVEVAKPKEDSANREGGGRGRGGRRMGGFRGRGRGVFRGRGRGRGRGRIAWTGPRRFSNRRRQFHSGGDEPAPEAGTNGIDNTTVQAEARIDDVVDYSETTEDAMARGAFGGRRGRGRGRGRGGRFYGRGGRGAPRGTARRRGSGRGSLSDQGVAPNGEFAETGEPSKTTVFVANLPFAMDDDGLKDLFKQYKLKSAHVVKRRSGRSKGFGFVDLENEEEQTKVLEIMKNVVSDGRELVIKVALSEPHVFTTNNENLGVSGKNSKATPTNATTATNAGEV